LKLLGKLERRQPARAERGLSASRRISKTNVQTMVSRSLTSGEFANASSLYLAVVGRSFPGPNFQANRLSVFAAICDKMQFGSLPWILQ
jgi:hypothetical protein